MNEAIKKLLGDELAAQVEAALKGKGKDGKDVELVIGNDGSHVPADKLEGERQSRISAENALKATAELMKKIGGSGDPAKLGEDISTAQQKISTLETNHKAELNRIKRTTALKMGLVGKAHDPEDIIKLLDLEKIELDDNGNLKASIDDLTKSIKESKPYLFVEEKPAQPPVVSGVKPAEPTKPQPSAGGDEMAAWRAEAGL